MTKKVLIVFALFALLITGGTSLSLADSITEQLELNGKTFRTVNVNGKPYVSVKQVAQASGGEVHKNANTFVIGSRLDHILKKGVIRVGTTGDYKPFTYFNPV